MMNGYELADVVDKWAHSESAEYLTDAATMLRQQADQIAELERTLSIMEGEYPEPTIFAKITEFNSLEDAYNRIAQLEAKQKEILTEIKVSWTAVSKINGISRESAHKLHDLIKGIMNEAI